MLQHRTNKNFKIDIYQFEHWEMNFLDHSFLKVHHISNLHYP